MSSRPPRRHSLTRIAGRSGSTQYIASGEGETASETPLESLLNELRTRKSGLGGATLTSFSSALEALWANRTRSLLTALGIFIGIGAVIAALTLTQGATVAVNQQIARLGTNTITVVPGTIAQRGIRQRRSNQTLTLNDVEAVKHLQYVSGVTPFAGTGGQIAFGRLRCRAAGPGGGGGY